jgi:hypothetical protein
LGIDDPSNSGAALLRSVLLALLLIKGFLRMVLPSLQPGARPDPYFVLRSGPSHCPALGDLAACGSALAARLSALLHRFAVVFPALCRAGFAKLGTNAAHALGETRFIR